MTKIISSLMCLCMFGCACNDTRSFSNLSTSNAYVRLGSAIYFLDKCPSQSDEEAAILVAPLIAAGISLAATFAVNTITKAIDENKKGLTGQFVAGGIGNIDNLDEKHCLVLVRGLFGSTRKNVAGDMRIVKLLPTLKLADYPVFYLELQSVAKKDSSVVELKPIFLSYAASSAKSSGSGRKHVSMAIGFSETAPAAADAGKEEKAFATFRHDLGRLEIGKSYEAALLEGTSSIQSRDKLKKGPFNVSAVITESEDPSIALQALSESFESKKDALRKALEDVIGSALGQKKDQK